MEMLGNPSWHWGLSLIVLTVTIHAAALLIMAFAGGGCESIWKREAFVSGT